MTKGWLGLPQTSEGHLDDDEDSREDGAGVGMAFRSCYLLQVNGGDGLVPKMILKRL